MRLKKFKASKTSIKFVHLARKINTKLFLTFRINSQNTAISLMPIHSESKLILYPQLRKFITHLTLLLISDSTLITTKTIRFVCSHIWKWFIDIPIHFQFSMENLKRIGATNLIFSYRVLNPGKIQR